MKRIPSFYSHCQLFGHDLVNCKIIKCMVHGFPSTITSNPTSFVVPINAMTSAPNFSFCLVTLLFLAFNMLINKAN